jgi:hypothetical protein
MFHRSEKAIRYAKELDEARLNGQFHLIPTLARKLLKHDPQKHCTFRTHTGLIHLGVASSALCEKALNDIIAPLEKEERELALRRDGPTELVLPSFVKPETMQDIVKSVDEAMNQSGTQEEKEVCSL